MRNQEIINSISNGNGNWLAREEKEDECQEETCFECKNDPEIKICGTCCKGCED
jgi:hypothetical protein